MQPRPAPFDLAHALHGYHTLLAQLAGIGVAVVHSDIYADAEWDPVARTMHLRADASITKHVRELTDLLQIARLPGHRTRARPIGRHLHAVP